MNGTPDLLDSLTAGFAGSVVAQLRSVEDAAQAVTSSVEVAATRLGATLPAAVAYVPPVGLEAAVPPPAGPAAVEVTAALVPVPAVAAREAPGSTARAVVAGPAPPAAVARPAAPVPAPLALTAPVPLPVPAPPSLPLPASATRLAGAQPFLALVDIAPAQAGGTPSVSATPAPLPAGALPPAAGAVGGAAAMPASAALPAESTLPRTGPRPLGEALGPPAARAGDVLPEPAPTAGAQLVERIVAPAAPPASSEGPAAGLTVNGGVNVTVSAQTIDVDNAEATARIIAAHVAEEIDRLTERDRFRRGLPTTSTA